MEDNKILDLFFSRSELALEAARLKFGKRLFITAKNILHSNEDAEECVNDTLMKAWEFIPPNRPELPGAYLAKIVRNIAINKYNARNAAKRGGGAVTTLIGELAECVPSLDSTQPERVFERGQTSTAINAFLEKADKPARVAFVLRYFHGESILDIANRFEVSESKVKSILFRLRKKLRAHLEKEGIQV